MSGRLRDVDGVAAGGVDDGRAGSLGHGALCWRGGSSGLRSPPGTSWAWRARRAIGLVGHVASRGPTSQTDETIAGANFGNQYGDYNGLSGYAGIFFFPSWTDRRSGGREEIWAARTVPDSVTD